MSHTKCCDVVRELRWPDGVRSPSCNADKIKKRGHHDRSTYRQRYVCHACGQQFDDLSWSLLRSWLRPHRGVSQEKLPWYLGFFEFVHNVRRRGKALLHSLLATLVAS